MVLTTQRAIAIQRESGRIVAETLDLLQKHVKPGVTTGELDQIAYDYIKSRGAIPSFKGYGGFPASVCISVNEESVHGIPGARVLNEGDLISLDCGAFYRGFHGDAAVTVGVGQITPAAQRIIDKGWESLWAGIAKARAGNHVEDISAAIQQVIEDAGYGVVRNLVGHGVGRRLHEDPQVTNYGTPGHGPILQPGLVIAVEPMLTEGTYENIELEDGWTIITADGKLSVHVEHTIAITEGEPDILTLL